MKLTSEQLIIRNSHYRNLANWLFKPIVDKAANYLFLQIETRNNSSPRVLMECRYQQLPRVPCCIWHSEPANNPLPVPYLWTDISWLTTDSEPVPQEDDQDWITRHPNDYKRHAINIAAIPLVPLADNAPAKNRGQVIQDTIDNTIILVAPGSHTRGNLEMINSNTTFPDRRLLTRERVRANIDKDYNNHPEEAKTDPWGIEARNRVLSKLSPAYTFFFKELKKQPILLLRAIDNLFHQPGITEYYRDVKIGPIDPSLYRSHTTAK